jgi:hypothetical protein
MKHRTPNRPQGEGTPSEDPFFSFAHLAQCFPPPETGREEPAPGYGFSSPREETLYETGILFKSFMKC